MNIEIIEDLIERFYFDKLSPKELALLNKARSEDVAVERSFRQMQWVHAASQKLEQDSIIEDIKSTKIENDKIQGSLEKIEAVIIDDEIHSINNLKRLLSKEYANVQVINTFNDPVEALHYLQSNLVDLVFLDIRMPQMNGLELLQNLQPAPFKVIFITGYQEYEQQAMRLAAIDFILKPVDSDDLKKAMEKYDLVSQDQRLEILRFNLNSVSTKQIAFPSPVGYHFIDSYQLVKIQYQGNLFLIELADGSEFFSTDNAILDEDLNTLHFARVNPFTLINYHQILDYKISPINSQVNLKNNQTVELTERYQKSFLEGLNS